MNSIGTIYLAEDTSWFDMQEVATPQQSNIERATGVNTDGWASLLEIADQDVHALLVTLRDAGLPLPVVGYELSINGAVVATAELAWPGSQIAVVLDGQDQDYQQFTKQAWDVRYASDTTADSLASALEGGA